MTTRVRIALLVGTIHAATAALLVVDATTSDIGTRTNLLSFGLLVTLAVGYAEVSRQVEQRRWFIARQAHVDFTSVWAIAAALILPGPLMAAAVAVIFGQLWFRVRRHDERAKRYRAAYTATAVVLSGLAAAALRDAIGPIGGGPLTPIGGVVGVLAAMLAYVVVNRLLVAVAVVVSGGPRTVPVLVGTFAAHRLELTTLGLGAGLALALTEQRWLAALPLGGVFLLQQRALINDLVEAATRDAKTALLNAEAWRRGAERRLQQARSSGTPATVLVLDMDRFKVLNDTYGHLAGDVALRAVASAVVDELRGDDVVGRFGGEEFVAFLPGVDASAAAGIAGRVCARIADLDVEVAGRDDDEQHRLALRASIGAAVLGQHGSGLDDLLRAADEAMYAAKRGGGNGMRVAAIALQPAR